MGFFEDFATNIKGAADVLGEKAGSIYDVSKLTYTAAGVKSEIKNKLTDFGKSVYEGLKTEDFDIYSLSEEIEKIDALYAQLESINDLIAKAKNQRLCKSCGSAVSKDAEYCERCGEKL